MSACNNLLWAGLGAAAGFALALYVDDIVRNSDEGSDDDGDGEGPNLRVVDDEEDPPHPFEHIEDEPGDA